MRLPVTLVLLVAAAGTLYLGLFPGRVMGFAARAAQSLTVQLAQFRSAFPPLHSQKMRRPAGAFVGSLRANPQTTFLTGSTASHRGYFTLMKMMANVYSAIDSISTSAKISMF